MVIGIEVKGDFHSDTRVALMIPPFQALSGCLLAAKLLLATCKDVACLGAIRKISL